MATAIVCGGRSYDDKEAVNLALDTFDASDDGPLQLVFHGGASGADMLANMWAVSSGVASVAFPAQWRTHGRSAGPIRNREMLDALKSLPGKKVVIAFPGGRGTANMVSIAREAGIEVQEPNQ